MPNTWGEASTGAPSSSGTSGPVCAPGPAYPPAHSVNRSHTANTRSGSALNSPSLTVAASITPSPSMITRRPLARPMRMRPPSALGRVTSGHQRGQVLGLNERRRGRRTPVVQAAGALDDRRFPQLIVQDDVQVGVVLREVADRVLQVPEEVGPDVVAAQPPDVPLRMAVQHRRGPAPDLVDVGRGATAMLDGHPERHVWGLGRHHIGSNFFWYLKDPVGNFSEYYSDLDIILDDQLWKPSVVEGARGLYNWGPPPPPSFLEPEDLAALMTGNHAPVG